jgi:hypothetical protein
MAFFLEQEIFQYRDHSLCYYLAFHVGIEGPIIQLCHPSIAKFVLHGDVRPGVCRKHPQIGQIGLANRFHLLDFVLSGFAGAVHVAIRERNRNEIHTTDKVGTGRSVCVALVGFVSQKQQERKDSEYTRIDLHCKRHMSSQNRRLNASLSLKKSRARVLP